jgi:hypothetical protein
VLGLVVDPIKPSVIWLHVSRFERVEKDTQIHIWRKTVGAVVIEESLVTGFQKIGTTCMAHP